MAEALATLGIDPEKLPMGAKVLFQHVLDGKPINPRDSQYLRGELAELRRPNRV